MSTGNKAMCLGCLETEFSCHLTKPGRLCRACVADGVDPGECECGAGKEHGALCCDECAWRDGILVNAAANGHRGAGMHGGLGIVSALRALGGAATIDALVDASGVCYRTVWWMTKKLAQRGRIEVRTIEDRDENYIKLRYVTARRDTRQAPWRRGTWRDHEARRGYYVAVTSAGKVRAPKLYVLVDRRAA